MNLLFWLAVASVLCGLGLLVENIFDVLTEQSIQKRKNDK